MGPTPPLKLPPVTAEYASTFQQATAQSPPAQSQYKFSRSASGQTRVDSGNTSVITNPATAQTIVLDHAKQTATIQPSAPPAPAPPTPGMPQMPKFSAPSMPAMPNVPGVNVQDLGKTMMQGHEVQGQRFVAPPIAPAKLPQIPGMPAAPGAPQIPGMPGAPKPPQMAGAPPAPGAPQIPGMPAAPKLPQIPGLAGAMPKLPQIPGMPGAPKAPQIPGMPGAPATPPPPAAPPPPATSEVWTSTKMGVPMLAKMTGSFGQLTQVCHSAIPGEPHPSTFQIPPGYKVIGA